MFTLSLIAGALIFFGLFFTTKTETTKKNRRTELMKERNLRRKAINEWAYSGKAVNRTIAYWEFIPGQHSQIMFKYEGEQHLNYATLSFDYSGPEIRVDAVKCIDKDGKVSFMRGVPIQRLPKEVLKAVYRAEKNDARRIAMLNKIAAEAVDKEVNFSLLEYQDINEDEFMETYSNWELAAFADVLRDTFDNVKYSGNGIYNVSGIAA